MTNILDAKLAVAYSQEVMDEANRWGDATPEQFKWFCDRMKRGLMVGEMRYTQEILRYDFPDQEAALGPDWKRGFAFLASLPSDICRRFHEKWRQYEKSGNTENLIDMANYAVFLYLLGAWTFNAAFVNARYCLIEFFDPRLPGADYRPEDRPDDGTKPITAERREWFARTPGAH